MTGNGQLVDRIVAKVMARLAGSSLDGPVRSETHVKASRPASEPLRTDTATQPLADRVITGALLEECWKGARTIEVAATAVLTPSARDFFKAHRVACVRRAADETSAAERSRRLVIHVQTTPEIRRFVEQWQRTSATDTSFELVSDAEEAASLATSAVCRGEVDQVVVVAAAAELTACLANRNAKVRAAAVISPDRIDAVKETMDPNVWILDPAGKSYFEFTNLWKKLIC